MEMDDLRGDEKSVDGLPASRCMVFQSDIGPTEYSLQFRIRLEINKLQEQYYSQVYFSP
jgi:hypothetical protein